MKKNACLLLFAVAFLFACKKSDVPGVPVEEVPIDTGYHYKSDYAYNLNVVYFIASGKTANDDYHRRISEMMLQGQEFYGKWMKHWGFGDKSFGLLKDVAKKRIKIVEIKGKLDQSNYSYSGGAGNVLKEIDEYFLAHPTEKTSDHTLIIMCVQDIQADNAPFYGLGRNCFALDYPGMDIKDLGTGTAAGDKATGWIGGLMHELGHGINLPHNGGQKSENAQFGTSLMGAGNSSYGRTPTYLTKADCAILNNNQVFSKVTKTDWYSPFNATISHLNAKYEAGNIVVSGRLSGAGAVNYINFYNDGNKNGIGGNKDYDAVPWSTQKIGLDSFYVSMPLSEFSNTEDYAYELRIMLCNENGSLLNVPYPYEIKNGSPVIDFGDKKEYSKTNWQVIDFSSEETVEEDGKVTNLLDKNNTTAWVTRWNSNAPTFPHHFVVNMGQALAADGFAFTQRGGSSKIKDMQILTSNDNIAWTALGNYVLKDVGGPQFIYLPSTKTFKYFKVIVTSATDGRQYASLAEVGVFKN